MKDGRASNGGWRGSPASLANLRKGGAPGPKPGLAQPFNRLPPGAVPPIIKALFREIDKLPESYAVIARRAGVTPQSLTYWKRGHRNPGLFDFVALANAVGFNLRLEKINEDD